MPSIHVATSAGPALLATDHLMATAEGMAADGLRVLAIGMRRWPELPSAENVFEVEHDLTLLGFVGLVDPPREEARAAVTTCRQAGIVPVMITGMTRPPRVRSRGGSESSTTMPRF